MSDDAARSGLSVIIPAYNEAGAIGGVVARLLPALERLGGDHEVIVVDDGSADGTAEAVGEHPRVRVLRHKVNRGYGASLKTGTGAMVFDKALFYDADGQFRAEDIPRLWEAALDGADMATGMRGRDSDAPLVRRPGKKLLSWTANFLARRSIPDLNCGFRIVRREALESYRHLLPDGFSASTTLTLLLVKEGWDVRFVPVTIERRVGSASTVNILTDGFDTLMLIVRLVVLVDPLRVFLTASGMFFLVAVLWAVPYLLRGRGVTIATLFLLISGVLTFLIGLLADQISNLRREYRR